jgi:hypothetical protein
LPLECIESSDESIFIFPESIFIPTTAFIPLALAFSVSSSVVS